MESTAPFHGLNFIFFGSGDFATLVFKELLSHGLPFKAVVTLPPRPKGRGRKLKDPEVKIIARDAGIDVFQPENPNDEAFIDTLRRYMPHFIILADYGKILRKKLLELPDIYPLNIHPSLLPRYRGAAPIERAMMDCQKETGVSLMVMDEGLDTGPIISQEKVEIGDTEIKTELMERLARVGAHLTLSSIPRILSGELKPVPQSGEPSYAKKIMREELWISWDDKAEKVKCKINALSTRPGAKDQFGPLMAKLIRAKVAEEQGGEPGKMHVSGGRLLVEALDFMVEILEIQPQGKRIMKAEEFLRGYRKKIL